MRLAGILSVHAFFLLLISMPACHRAHNITAILADHPDLADFNHYLSTTHLAADINSGNTITVLAVDNTALAPLLARGLPPPVLRNVLSLHVLSDYYDAAKLHRLTGGSVLVSSLFQASGDAPGSGGIVNISMRVGGRVAFALHDAENSPPTVFFIKSIKETPYNISVIEVSSVLSSPAAEAPAPPPVAVNLTDIMSTNGCKGFADLLLATADAADTFQQSIDSGLSVFCPVDKAVAAFLPKFKNLTADGQLALLLYHGVPVYYSLQMLKSDNGDMNTLATDGAKNYNFTVRNDGDTVTFESEAPKAARVTGTLKDKDPLAVYSIDAVLMPRELFNAAHTPAPALAPTPVSGPEPKHESPPAPGPPDGMAPSPDADDQTPADQKNGASVAAGWRLAMVVAAAAVPAIVMVIW